MDLNVLIHDLLPMADIHTLKSFACSHKAISNAINNEQFWEQRCDLDFINDSSYSLCAQVKEMENTPTWKKFYKYFSLMRKYQIDDQAFDSFSWKGQYTFGYAWIRGTRIALTHQGATLCNRMGINYIPDDLEQYFLYGYNPNFWLDSPDELISRINKHFECVDFKICTDGDDYHEERDDNGDVYLIRSKGSIICELNKIKKVAKFLYYDFKSV